MADKYLNLAGTKKLYDDLRARLVNAGGKIDGIESTEARTITSADAKEQYRTYWDHATTYGSGKPIDINWTLKNIPTSLVNPIITASHFDDNKLVVAIKNDSVEPYQFGFELWISGNKGVTFRKSKWDSKSIYGISIKDIDYLNGKWYAIMTYAKRSSNGVVSEASDMIYSSGDLDSWLTEQGTIQSENRIINCLAHDKTKEYACGGKSVSGSEYKAWIGVKGENNQWTDVTSIDPQFAVNLNAPLVWIQMNTFGGLGAALGTDGTTIFTQDSINWTGRVGQLASTVTASVTSDTLFKWYAACENGDFKYMDMKAPENGWYPVTINKGQALINALAFENGMIVAGTNDGKLYYSEDGTNFTASTTDVFTGKDITTINFLGDRWLAGTNSKQFGDCPLAVKSELVKFFNDVNEKLTVPEKYDPLSLNAKATGTFNLKDGSIKNLASIRCNDNRITLIADDGIRVEDNIDNIAGYNLIIDNLVLNLEPVVIINNLVNSNNNLPEADTSAIEKEVKNKADKSYVDESITNAIGSIDTALDQINGEVL